MSEITKSNVTFSLRSCRVCLNSSSRNIITLDVENGWLEMFEYCFNLSLSSHDEPRVLCQPCSQKLQTFFKFKKQCYMSDKLWKTLNNEKSTTEKIELDVQDELLNTEEYTNDCDNNIKPIDNDTSNSNNKSVDNDVNDKAINESEGNDNSLDILQCDGDNSIIIINYSETDETTSIKLNEKDNFNQSIVNYIVTNSNETIKCEKCQRIYASQYWYNKHIESCDAEKLNPMSFINKRDTIVHSQDILNITKTPDTKRKLGGALYFCGICTYSSHNNENVNKHLDEHWTNNDLQCMLCEFCGKDQAAIAAHRYAHSTEKHTRFDCHICQKKTKSLLTLQFHYRKIHLNKIGGLCSQPQCNKVYKSWKLWKIHEKLHNHPGYECDICGKKYRHRQIIIEHLINHTNPPSHVCDVCGRSFLRLRNLRVHLENVHSKPDPIKCSHCNRMFKNQHYLRVHQRREAMAKVWKCEFCPMEYPMQSGLNCHMRTHSDERPHCCHICGIRYKSKSQLIVHMRIHTGSRPFKCEQCSKAFTTSGQLKTHSIVHTGILPYKCPHCEKSFRLKKRMQKHCAFNHKVVVVIEKK